MRARLCTAHFWGVVAPGSGAPSGSGPAPAAAGDQLTVKHTDLSAFRYENKKSASDSVYREGKKIYAEKRGQVWAPSTKRPFKLKDALRELSELLKEHRTIYCRWKNEAWLCTIFSTGVVAYLNVNSSTGDIIRILFDRYLVGKLLSADVSEVLYTDTHILFTYNDNQAVLVNFNKQSMKSIVPEKLSKRDPKFQIVELVGGWRRGGRQISGAVGGEFVLIWSRASPSDLFPWSPRAPNEDHANVHVYSLRGSEIHLKYFHRIEFDPISVEFSKLQEKIIYSVEQKTSKKGGIIIECRELKLGNGNDLEEVEAIRVAAPATATCAARSSCETYLLLACSDRSVLLHHYLHNITTTVTAAFVPRTCCWWQDSGGPAVMIGGIGLQLQCWDTALAPIHLAPVSDHLPSSPILDLSSYFRKEPTMTNLLWNCYQRNNVLGSNGYASGDDILIAIMEDGPLVCIRICAPSTFQGEDGGGGPVYLGSEATAIARLRTMDWGSHGTSCLALLHRIINSLFSRPLTLEREDLAQAALGTFLAPSQPIPSSIRHLHLPQLHDLCRRFFQHLMRYGRLEKAFSLAIDVGHHDLFIDIKYAAEAIGADDLANEAALHAEEVLSTSGSSCSHLSCSNCSSSTDVSLEEERVADKNIIESNKKIDLYGSPTHNHNHQVHRSPPPLPFVPASHSSFVKSMPPLINYPVSKISHKQKYAERENFPWNENIIHPLDGMAPAEGRVLHRVVEIIPQPITKSQSAHDLFQTELPENAANAERSIHVDRKKSAVNTMNTDVNLNVYTPVYHQHPTLSGRIPSTISTLPAMPPSYLPSLNNRELILPNSSRETSHLSMESIQEESPLQSSLYNNRGYFSNSLLWNNRRTPVMNKNPAVPMFNPKTDYLSSSLSQINKVGLPLIKHNEKSISQVLNNSNKIIPVPVIKSSNSGSNENDGIAAKPAGEKNKVKFSDTVTVAVVPEICRKERRMDRIGPNRIFSSSNSGGIVPDPRRELADSLPLCHPNDDYLKDFAPQTDNEDNKEKQTKIKVVHFGVV